MFEAAVPRRQRRRDRANNDSVENRPRTFNWPVFRLVKGSDVRCSAGVSADSEAARHDQQQRQQTDRHRMPFQLADRSDEAVCVSVSVRRDNARERIRRSTTRNELTRSLNGPYFGINFSTLSPRLLRWWGLWRAVDASSPIFIPATAARWRRRRSNRPGNAVSLS